MGFLTELSNSNRNSEIKILHNKRYCQSCNGWNHGTCGLSPKGSKPAETTKIKETADYTRSQNKYKKFSPKRKKFSMIIKSHK